MGYCVHIKLTEMYEKQNKNKNKSHTSCKTRTRHTP